MPQQARPHPTARGTQLDNLEPSPRSRSEHVSVAAEVAKRCHAGAPKVSPYRSGQGKALRDERDQGSERSEPTQSDSGDIREHDRKDGRKDGASQNQQSPYQLVSDLRTLLASSKQQPHGSCQQRVLAGPIISHGSKSPSQKGCASAHRRPYVKLVLARSNKQGGGVERSLTPQVPAAPLSWMGCRCLPPKGASLVHTLPEPVTVTIPPPSARNCYRSKHGSSEGSADHCRPVADRCGGGDPEAGGAQGAVRRGVSEGRLEDDLSA